MCLGGFGVDSGWIWGWILRVGFRAGFGDGFGTSTVRRGRGLEGARRAGVAARAVPEVALAAAARAGV